MRCGDGDNTSARFGSARGGSPCRATARISPASHRGRKIVARCAGGDPLWARRRERQRSLRMILGATGDCRGEAGGASSGVLAIRRSPESKMSAAGRPTGFLQPRARGCRKSGWEQSQSRSGDGGAIIGPLLRAVIPWMIPFASVNAAESGREIEFLPVNAGFGRAPCLTRARLKHAVRTEHTGCASARSWQRPRPTVTDRASTSSGRASFWLRRIGTRRSRSRKASASALAGNPVVSRVAQHPDAIPRAHFGRALADPEFGCCGRFGRAAAEHHLKMRRTRTGLR